MDNFEQLRRNALKRQLSIVESTNVVPHATGNGLPVIPERASGSDRMTGLGEHLVLSKPLTSAPSELYWSCSICGLVEPLYIPSGRWIKRSCTCQRAKRRAQHDQEQMRLWAIEQRSLCFGGWLGRQWASESIVKDLSRKVFENYDYKRFPEAFALAKNFVANPRGNLIFTGSYGTGKTHLAVAIVNALLEQGKSCRFASATQLYESYLETRKQFDQMAHIQLQERLYGCAFLFLDDVDKIEPTTDIHRFYFTLFDERYKARKSTIITTNRYDELDHYIGAAAFSRLSRAMRTEELIGDDYRLEESFDW